MSLPILPGARGWPSVLLAGAAPGDGAPGGQADAWEAYRSAVTSLTPDAVISVVSEAGLRGAGGSGFPTGRKWRDVATQPAGQRFVVAHGFEADPGAQVDRTLMELDPHAVLEGIAIAAWAVRADSAIIAVRASATTAVARLRSAIAEAEARGFLGSDPAQTGRPLQVEVRELTGGFVVGEETVLLRALEQRRAQPDQRPPYPSRSGLWGRPTLVNNVKTLAAVPWIVRQWRRRLRLAWEAGGARHDAPPARRRGAQAWHRRGAHGHAHPRGARRPGRVRHGKLKAVLVGGPIGGFLPADALDTPLTPDALREAGALAGSGTLLAVDGSTCLVDLAALMTRYVSDEACGKTIPCRIGTRRLSELGGRLLQRPRPTRRCRPGRRPRCGRA